MTEETKQPESKVFENALAVALGIALVLVCLWLFVSCKAEVRIQPTQSPQTCIYNEVSDETICK